MKLLVSPPPPLPVFSQDLELVILVQEESIPQIFVEEGVPRPDRHLLLGLIQAVSMSVQERDPESVVCTENCAMRLDRSGDLRQLEPGLVIVRSKEGRFGVLAASDHSSARRLARQALRWFTGTIRLDVP